jgi:hypothetical protein
MNPQVQGIAVMTTGTVNKSDVRVHIQPAENVSASSVLQEGALVDIITQSADGSWLLVSPRLKDAVASIGWMRAQYINYPDTIPAEDIQHVELSEEQFAEIIEAVHQWATGHPNSDGPLTLVRGRMLSPKALAREMEDKTELGRPFLNYLAHEATRTGNGVTEPIYRAIIANQSR